MSFQSLLQVADTTTLSAVNIPLFSEVFYSYTIPLEEKTFTVEFLWLSRLNEWTWSLYDEDDTPLMLGEVLVFNYFVNPPLESNLTGAFLLLPNMTTVGNYDDLKYNLSDYYSFVYVYQPTTS